MKKHYIGAKQEIIELGRGGDIIASSGGCGPYMDYASISFTTYGGSHIWEVGFCGGYDTDMDPCEWAALMANHSLCGDFYCEAVDDACQ